MDLNEIESRAMESKQIKDEFVAVQYGEDDDHDDDSDLEHQPQYLHMELRSTSVF